MARPIQSAFGVRFRFMPLVTALLAHQRGWDEVILVAAPIVVIVTVLAIVKRRVDAKAAREQRDHV